MAYNNNNYYKKCRRIVAIYKEHKHADVPDTQIVNRVFPKFDIHITYRQWMNIKGMRIPKEA